jgi:glycosyltransferase involved in cell wall biosynthesis
MRVALFTDGIYPYVIGGMQKHSFNMARFLARAGVEVDLYHFNQSEKDIRKLELFEESEKKKIRSFVIPFPDSGKLPGHYIRASFQYSCEVYKSFLSNGTVDYIYAKGFSGWKTIDAKFQGKQLPPIGVNFHGYEMFQKADSIKVKLEQFLLKAPVKFNLLHADHVFSYGGRVTELLRKHGVPSAKIKELPAGIEASWLAETVTQTKDIRRFVFVGRYEHRKGIEVLNQVLRSLKSYNFEFVFVGPIPESRRLQLPGISYAGRINEEEALKNILRACDVLVCPSFSEGMPNVILEAMASGLAIIATDVGAVAEMTGTDNGWLIRAGSEPELRTALIQAIGILPAALNLKKNNSLRKIAAHFLWPDLIERLIAYLP